MPQTRSEPARTHAGLAPHLAGFDAAGRAALDSMVLAMNDTDIAVPALSDLLGVPQDLAMATLTPTAPVAAALREVARLVVRRALAPNPSDDAELRAAREALDFAGVVWRAAYRPAERVPLPHVPRRRERDEPWGELNDLFREIGLEEYDADMGLMVRDGTGEPVLAWAALPPESTFVLLLSRLYPRLEIAMMADELLLLERRAAHWYFQRWSAPPTEDTRFAWTVREQEFSLVARDTLAFGEPATSGYMQQPLFAETPARQQRLAEALDDSFSSVFIVREAADGRLLLEDAATRALYTVHEHSSHLGTCTGALAFGRLIPWEQDVWLRSPGMVFMKTAGAERLAVGLVDLLERSPYGIERATAVEIAIARLSGGKRASPPNRVLPADSPREAAELIDVLHAAMGAVDLMEEAPAEEAPAELRAAMESAPGSDEAHFYRLLLDDVLAEWLTALTQQARPTTQSRSGAKRKPKKGKKGKWR